ncbi:hypothetical protein BDF19DRAFT_285056 [Syncephalis fuscata]|nr:hypothetical protein BDF19DRAFT_285056 [Syncephalis fuscata]
MSMLYSPDIQVYWRIQQSGDKGVTLQELSHQLGHPGNKILQRYLENISDSKLLARQIAENTALALTSNKAVNVVRAVEFAGRSRRYRYFSPESYDQFMKQEGLPSQSTKSNKKMITNTTSAAIATPNIKTPTTVDPFPLYHHLHYQLKLLIQPPPPLLIH